MSDYPTLWSKRLCLRCFELSDSISLVSLVNDFDVVRFSLNIPHPYTVEMAQNWISSLKHRFDEWAILNFAITEIQTGCLVGAIGLVVQEEHDRAELGYWIGRTYRGKGYAEESIRKTLGFCFTELGLHKVYATIFADNTISSHLLEKVGMVKEGYHQDHVLKWGRHYDIISYGIVSSMAEAQQYHL